ncbi:hypothetical protein H4V95_001517 [Arthrobacter sp. CAN_C5]|nr:hypothetical protein [Arthrobacter sp. CAN_C5]
MAQGRSVGFEGIQRDPETSLDFLREGTRPSPPLICRFLDRTCALGYGIESICAVRRDQGRQDAARTYRVWKTRLPALRTLEGARPSDALRALNLPDTKGRPRPEIIYARRKMTQWLRRIGFPEASEHTGDRLMREKYMNGLIRGHRTRTTVPSKEVRRAVFSVESRLHSTGTEPGLGHWLYFRSGLCRVRQRGPGHRPLFPGDRRLGHLHRKRHRALPPRLWNIACGCLFCAVNTPTGHRRRD